MSDLLARFQAQTRRKADSDLIRRWEWDARYHGDKNIKIQASNAKRSATQMQKIKEQFSSLSTNWRSMRPPAPCAPWPRS